jgi:acyloxyacyl hydrolase
LDWSDAIAEWVDSGRDAAELIEPFDGFHPSQTGNALLADTVWNWLMKYYPEAVGPVNPHNAEIAARFGDQGGH